MSAKAFLVPVAAALSWTRGLHYGMLGAAAGLVVIGVIVFGVMVEQTRS